MNTRIADVLKAKGSLVIDIACDEPVARAVQIMADKKIGSLLVREGDRVVGILTERDLGRAIMLAHIDLSTTPVKSMMSSPVVYVQPSTSIGDSLKVMTETHCRHLPVFDEGELVGIISVGDLLRWMTGELEAHVLYLESYIRGR